MKPILPIYGKSVQKQSAHYSTEQILELNIKKASHNHKSDLAMFNSQKSKSIFPVMQDSFYSESQMPSKIFNPFMFPTLKSNSFMKVDKEDGRVSPLLHINDYAYTKNFIPPKFNPFSQNELFQNNRYYPDSALLVSSFKNDVSKYKNPNLVKRVEQNLAPKFNEMKFPFLESFDEELSRTYKINSDINLRQKTLENLRLGSRKPTYIDLGKLKYSQTKVLHFFTIIFLNI